MDKWLKIIENLAHKRAGVILAAIAAVAFVPDLSLEKSGAIIGGAIVFTLCQTISEIWQDDK